MNLYKDWCLEGQLGRGGFGQVLLWKNRRSNAQVAIKFMKENKNLPAEELHKLKQRWRKEYDCVSKLHSPYIISSAELNDSDFVNWLASTYHGWLGLPIISMEYCNGGDLRRQLNRPENANGLSEWELLSVMLSLRNAIEFLHANKLQHRDLKPDNIMIQKTASGKKLYKITDFGFARDLPEHTMAQSLVGTRHYFAPEIVDTAEYNNSVDYWSAGVIAFELMTGRLPFIPHHSLLQIINNIKLKQDNCIAITEDFEQSAKFHQQQQLFEESRASLPLRRAMQHWLRIALHKDYKIRGSYYSSPAAPDVVQFYKELDAILSLRLLKVFCLYTCSYFSYAVDEQLSMQQLLQQMQNDTGIPSQQFYFVLPLQHPAGQVPLPHLRPLDLYVEQWAQQASAPAMLYLAGFNCEYKATAQVSSSLKHWLALGNDVKLPAWQQSLYEQHADFLLWQQHEQLSAFLESLLLFAAQVDHDMTLFQPNIEQLCARMHQLLGRQQQLQLLVNHSAAQARQQALPSPQLAFFEHWQKQSNAMQRVFDTSNNKIVLQVQKRYNSALRRIQKLAGNSAQCQQLAAQTGKSLLLNFRKYRAERKRFDCNYTKQLIFDCLKNRADLLKDSAIEEYRSTVTHVCHEFHKIRSIVFDGSNYLNEMEAKLNELSQQFTAALLSECLVVGLSERMDTLNLHDARQNYAADNENAMQSLANMVSFPTSDLIEDTQRTLADVVQLMNNDDFNDINMSELPATLTDVDNQQIQPL